MTDKPKKKRGRPPVKPKAGERVMLGLRVTPDIKRKLDAAADHNTRSQSQEAELRLERSFREEASFGGPELHQIALLMASAFALAGKRQAHPKPAAEWVNDPEFYLAALGGVVDALMRHRPKGMTQEHVERFVASLHGRMLTHLIDQ